MTDRRLVGWKPNAPDPALASVRIRCLNPLAELQRRGYPIELFDPAHSDSYAVVIYSKAYRDADYYEASALKAAGVRIAFDLCDNHLYNPKELPQWAEAGRRLIRMVALADAVSVSTDALAQVLAEHVSKLGNPVVIGDAVETSIIGQRERVWSRWRSRRRLERLEREIAADRAESRVPVVWFGNHGSPYAEGGMTDLARIRRVLEDVARQYPASLTVISNSYSTFLRSTAGWGIPTRYVEWRASTFLHALSMHALALIPVRDNAFTRCKTNNRLALALAMGLAVVADPVPSYLPFAQVARIGDWEGGLTEYLSSPAARERDATAGRNLVVRDWSIGKIADQWQHFFDRLRRR